MVNVSYPTSTSALILIDLLNDFLADDGKVNPAIRAELSRTNFVANLCRLIAGARRLGMLVVYAPHGLNDHSFDSFEHVHPRLQVAMQNHVFWEGDYGDEFFEPLKPQDGDIVVSHHKVFDAFIGTDLDQQLRDRAIDRVILAGLTSHTCVEGTGRHAIEAGYHLTFLTDAVAEFTEEAHNAAVNLSYPTFGFEVLTIDEFLRAAEASRK